MIDLSKPSNEWLAVEIKLCRAVLGLSQQQLALLTSMSVQSIKRLEKKGANARYKTVLKLRKVFTELGVHVQFDEHGVITTKLDDALVVAINNGELKQYLPLAMENIIAMQEEWFQ